MIVRDENGNFVASLDMASLEKPETAATPAELSALLQVGDCPKCGGELFSSYGLMGGGVGPMVLCDGDNCDFFRKHCEGPEAE